MRPILSLALASVIAMPLSAQVMGSVNENAPKVSTSIEYGNGTSVKVSYTAITWAEGKFMERIADPDMGERMRNFINTRAEQNPLGEVHLKGQVEILGRVLAPGSYTMHFMVTERATWRMVLKHKAGEDVHQFPLRMQDSPMMHDRLAFILTAGKGADELRATIAFGTKMVSVAGTIGAAEQDEKQDEKKDGKSGG